MLLYVGLAQALGHLVGPAHGLGPLVQPWAAWGGGAGPAMWRRQPHTNRVAQDLGPPSLACGLGPGLAHGYFWAQGGTSAASGVPLGAQSQKSRPDTTKITILEHFVRRVKF